MDFCRNVSVSSGLPSEYPPEQVLSPPCSKLGGLTGSLDDLFSGQNTEVDVSLEWLSIFVEDCLSSTGNCLPAPINLENTSTTPDFNPSKPLQQLRQKPQQTIPPPSLQKFVIPSKGARSKRKRGGTTGKSKTPLNSWAHHLNLESQTLILQGMMTSSSSDPPLLQQAYWLADSELIHEAPKPKPKLKPKPKMEEEEEEEEEDRGRVGDDEEEVERKEELVEEEEEEEEEESLEGNDDDNNNNNNTVNGEANANANGNGIAIASRRCSHCLAQRTPQWRAGPLGPKTLCNACGVRYKSGRLLPEYRPAKSPSFVSYLHSNSHKKVLEMRNMATTTLPSSSISP